MGMGYQGFVRFNGSDIVLATSASVNLVLEPLTSTAVWGAGWYNAATAAHYADAAIRYEGSVDIELQLGAGGAIWDFLEEWIISQRAYSKTLEISPDGARVMTYTASGSYDRSGAWNTNANFSTNEGSFVTLSLGVIALDRTMVDPAGGNTFSNYTYILQKKGVIADTCSDLAVTNPLNPSGNNVDPIPFWRTKAQLLRGTYSAPFTGGALPQAGTETMEWSVDVTQNHFVLYTCNGDRLPTALLQGPMDVSGNVVLYNPAGVFDPITGPDGASGTITSPYMYAENTWFRVEIATGGVNKVYIEIPAVLFEGDEYNINGPDSVTSRAFSMRGLGGRCNGAVTLPPCVISSSTGTFVAP